jgi:hypothetical protein
MPFRFLSYIARLLENTVTDRTAVYRKTLIELHRPEFYVVYKSAAGYHMPVTAGYPAGTSPIRGKGWPFPRPSVMIQSPM